MRPRGAPQNCKTLYCYYYRAQHNACSSCKLVLTLTSVSKRTLWNSLKLVRGNTWSLPSLDVTGAVLNSWSLQKNLQVEEDGQAGGGLRRRVQERPKCVRQSVPVACSPSLITLPDAFERLPGFSLQPLPAQSQRLAPAQQDVAEKASCFWHP